MHRIVNALAIALSILPDFPPVIVAAEPVNVAVSGTWTDVTPSGVDLTDTLPCGNYGSITMVADPARPSNLFTQFHCQGVWRSADFGFTWSGPINTGNGGAGVNGAGGLAIARGPDGEPPILYSAGIGGTGIGFWKSTDGGVSWTNYRVASGGDRQGFYPPVVDPNHPNHLLMTGHRSSLTVQSFDGGQNWSEVAIADGMKYDGGTSFIFSSIPVAPKQRQIHGSGLQRPPEEKSERGERATGGGPGHWSIATSIRTDKCRFINRITAAPSSCRHSI
jgi:hypothetical protein